MFYCHINDKINHFSAQQVGNRSGVETFWTININDADYFFYSIKKQELQKITMN